MEKGNENKGLAIVPQLAQLNHIKFAKDLGDSIKEGDVDPLVVHIFLKRIENIQKILKEDKEVGSAIKVAAGMHDGTGKQFSFMGAKLALTSVHTTYNYEQCGDILWTNLNEIFQQVKEMKEDREKFLKAAFPDKVNKFGFTAPRVVVEKLFTLESMDCGEEVVLNQPRKIQQEGVKVTFDKTNG